MKRYALLSAAVAVAVPAVMYAGQVNLQDTTPGIAQNGHINVSGTVKAGTVVGYSSKPTDIAYGGDFRSVSTSGRGVLGNASATTGVTYGGLFQSFSTSGRGIAGITSALTGPTVGGFFTTNSVNGKGVQGSSNATAGLNYGVYGRNVSPNGFALYGEGNGSFTGNLGVGTGTNPPTERLVVLGNAAISGTIAGNGSLLTNLNASALTTGTVSDSLLSADVARRNGGNAFIGNNTFTANTPTIIEANGGSDSQIGISAVVNGQNAIGIKASAVISGGTGVFGAGDSYGVYGQAANPAAFGVFSSGNVGISRNLGIGTGSATPQNRIQITDNDNLTQGLVRIDNGSTTSTLLSGRTGLIAYVGGNNFPIGVAAIAQSTDGTTTWGVRGGAYGTGTNYGVYGYAENGTTNWAGYFEGALFAQSSSAGVKAFLIDHPLDPANKYLRHSSIESDQRMNIYRGEVTTDSTGFATVTMPNWFEALNEKIQYQLTVVDESGSADFVLTKVAQRLKLGKFKIRTSQPNVTVNWMVSGERHDPTSQYMPLEVEEDKKGTARGKYLVPEAYGKDPSFGIVQRREVEKVNAKK